MKAANKQLTEWDAELNQLHERNGDLVLKVQMLEQELKEAQRDREANKNSAPTVAEFPEPADLLNQLKARRKKSKADLADMDTVVELLSLLWSSETVP
ncbi:flagellar alpha dynein [Microcoleus sp. A006_D1]|uniref:flagellar alpha dynein n=1 Tax=Microcoleus sp. A006_D1 TaxID=3055267 RepID=UPI002FD2957F